MIVCEGTMGYPATSMQTKCLVLTVLKEGVQRYTCQTQQSDGQAPPGWPFIELSQELCDACANANSPPRTNDLIYLSSMMPSCEVWRLMGKSLQIHPSSEEGRIHTWWWYRYRAILNEFAQLHGRTVQTCVQSMNDRT